MIINSTGQPFKSPNGQLPYLLHYTVRICGYTEIVRYLKCLGHTTANKNGLSPAYNSLMQDNLYPCCQYYLWGDSQNIDKTRNLYAQQIRFPFNFYYPSKYVTQVDKLMQIKENFSLEDNLENHNVIRLQQNAKQCMNVLDAKLNQKKYLLNSVSEVDANVYAYLSIISMFPMKNNPLKSHFDQSTNLIKYLKNFNKAYLSDFKFDVETETIPAEANNANSDIDANTKKLPKILAFVVAVTAMTVFATKHRLLRVFTPQKTYFMKLF